VHEQSNYTPVINAISAYQFLLVVNKYDAT